MGTRAHARVAAGVTREKIANGLPLTVTHGGTTYRTIVPPGTPPGGQFTAVVDPNNPQPRFGFGVCPAHVTPEELVQEPGQFVTVDAGGGKVVRRRIPPGTQPGARFFFEL